MAGRCPDGGGGVSETGLNFSAATMGLNVVLAGGTDLGQSAVVL